MVKTCCVTGLTPLNLPFGFDEESAQAMSIKDMLYREIEQAIESGCIRFISGMEWGIEIICAETILKLKAKHQNLRLLCVVPYEDQAAKWNEEYRNRYFDILEQANDMKLISQRFTNECYQLRDEYIVNHSHQIIAVINEEKSGAVSLVEKSIHKGMDTVLINPIILNRTHIAGRRKFNLV